MDLHQMYILCFVSLAGGCFIVGMDYKTAARGRKKRIVLPQGIPAGSKRHVPSLMVTRQITAIIIIFTIENANMVIYDWPRRTLTDNSTKANYS